MPGEIESVVEIAQAHVENTETANAGFADVGGAPSCGLQINQPTDAMRTIFDSANGICTNLCSYLGRDVKKILQMAEEFELWDKQACDQDE